MKSSKPLILVTNDDGYTAGGLSALVKSVVPLGRVLVVAPDGPRSGAGCSITSNVPVRIRLVSSEPNLVIYACSGSPVDCVKIALHALCNEQYPDLLVSGINHGDNSSVCVHYSGTVSAAIEGTMKGIPSIAFSLATHDSDVDFAPTLFIVRALCSRILARSLPVDVCLNVNFPVLSCNESYAGIRLCRMGRGRWDSEWVSACNPMVPECYWLTGSFTDLEPDSSDTDTAALASKYVSVTPISVDMTAFDAMKSLSDIELL